MELELSVEKLIERIKEKCALKELEPLGFRSGTISNWKANNTFPRANDLFKIAQHIGVSMEWLLTGEKMYMDELFLSEDRQEQFILSSRERELLKNYKELKEENKHSVDLITAAYLGK